MDFNYEKDNGKNPI